MQHFAALFEMHSTYLQFFVIFAFYGG